MNAETGGGLTAEDRAKVQAAHDEIARLCMGGRWIMSIPARPGYDSDLIIDEALSILEAGAALHPAPSEAP